MRRLWTQDAGAGGGDNNNKKKKITKQKVESLFSITHPALVKSSASKEDETDRERKENRCSGENEEGPLLAH